MSTPEDEKNQQRKAEHEADDDSGLVGTADNIANALVRPFTRDNVEPDEAEELREENDREQRS